MSNVKKRSTNTGPGIRSSDMLLRRVISRLIKSVTLVFSTECQLLENIVRILFGSYTIHGTMKTIRMGCGYELTLSSAKSTFLTVQVGCSIMKSRCSEFLSVIGLLIRFCKPVKIK